jgi:hypothetical protein
MKTNEIEWFVRFPGDFYATQFFDCVSEKDVRVKARRFLGVNRLPNNTEIWCNNKEAHNDY